MDRIWIALVERWEHRPRAPQRRSIRAPKGGGIVERHDMKLSTKDRESFRAVLESKRAELLRAHGQNIAAATELEEESLPDAMDVATRATGEGELLGLARQERELLAEIEMALSKLDAGTYGVSELSGRPIPIARLRAIPWARLTTEEEERRERQS
ncbi:TraR/DksA family transcriptional regulator [Labilithrix luteola]|nr:TraR/DksA family transcriptional regulator [Labilithrix luteola]